MVPKVFMQTKRFAAVLITFALLSETLQAAGSSAKLVFQPPIAFSREAIVPRLEWARLLWKGANRHDNELLITLRGLGSNDLLLLGPSPEVPSGGPEITGRASVVARDPGSQMLDELKAQFHNGQLTFSTLIARIGEISKAHRYHAELLDRALVVLASACEPLLNSRSRLSEDQKTTLLEALGVAQQIESLISGLEEKKTDPLLFERISLFATGLMQDIDERLSFDLHLAIPFTANEHARYFKELGASRVRRTLVHTPDLKAELRWIEKGSHLIEIEAHLDNGDVLIMDSHWIYLGDKNHRLYPSREKLEMSFDWEEMTRGFVREKPDLNLFPGHSIRPEKETRYLHFLMNINSVNDQLREPSWDHVRFAYRWHTEMRAAASMAPEHVVIEGLNNQASQHALRDKVMNAWAAMINTVPPKGHPVFYAHENVMEVLDGGRRIPRVRISVDPGIRHRVAESRYMKMDNILQITVPSVQAANSLTEDFLIGVMAYTFSMPGTGMPWNYMWANPDTLSFGRTSPDNTRYTIDQDIINDMQAFIIQNRSMIEEPIITFTNGEFDDTAENWVANISAYISYFGNAREMELIRRFQPTFLAALKQFMTSEDPELQSYQRFVMRHVDSLRIHVDPNRVPQTMIAYAQDKRQLQLNIAVPNILDEWTGNPEFFMTFFLFQFLQPGDARAVSERWAHARQQQANTTAIVELKRKISGMLQQLFGDIRPQDEEYSGLLSLFGRLQAADQDKSSLQTLQQDVHALATAAQGKRLRTRRMVENSDLARDAQQIQHRFQNVESIFGNLLPNYGGDFSQTIDSLSQRLSGVLQRLAAGYSILDERAALNEFNDLRAQLQILQADLSALMPHLMGAMAAQSREQEKPKRDFYDVLGVDRQVDGRELQRAYRKLALKFHPDRNPGDKTAEEAFRDVSEAYRVLSNDEKRKLYDVHGHSIQYDRLPSLWIQGMLSMGSIYLGMFLRSSTIDDIGYYLADGFVLLGLSAALAYAVRKMVWSYFSQTSAVGFEAGVFGMTYLGGETKVLPGLQLPIRGTGVLRRLTEKMRVHFFENIQAHEVWHSQNGPGELRAILSSMRVRFWPGLLALLTLPAALLSNLNSSTSNLTLKAA